MNSVTNFVNFIARNTLPFTFFFCYLQFELATMDHIYFMISNCETTEIVAHDKLCRNCIFFFFIPKFIKSHLTQFLT
eukprot:TRINITY_DN1378_c2_g1_i1.p1 TRINITY_DN1378_c2_g1~~TRINITY_DN1378_c2_g1_i1.p1  ORF type:complete len:77 (+),score=8.50 TRINITY_DN1378_c2_g1_i1:380-610(+)